MTNEQFSEILKQYHPNLHLIKNNNLANIQQLYFGNRLLGGVPLNYYPIEDQFEGEILTYRGLKNIAALLWDAEIRDTHYTRVFTPLTVAMDYKIGLSKFEWLLDSFGIQNLDKVIVMANMTNKPEDYGMSREELDFYIRLSNLGVWGQRRVELMKVLNKNHEPYTISTHKLKEYIWDTLKA